MASIDDLLKLELTDEGEKQYLDKKGVKEHTNKNAIIQTLIDAAAGGDVKAAIFLMENSTQDTTNFTANTAVEKARNRTNAKKAGKTNTDK